jgi:hypothetical protein
MALKVTIEGLPEGAKVKATLIGRPLTREEFAAIVDALGGPAAWKVGYNGENLYYDGREGGQPMLLYPPEGYGAPKPLPGHPFIREFGERIQAAKGGEES